MGMLSLHSSGHLSRRSTGHLGRHQSLPHNVVHNAFAHMTLEDAVAPAVGWRWRYDYYDCAITYGLLYNTLHGPVYGYSGVRTVNDQPNGLIRYSSYFTSYIDDGYRWAPYSSIYGEPTRVRVVAISGSGASSVWSARAIQGTGQIVTGIYDWGTRTGSTPVGQYAAMFSSSSPIQPFVHVYL